MIELEFPWPPKELSPNARLHWAAKAKVTKAYRTECGWLAKQKRIKIEGDGPIKLEVTFWQPDKRRRDRDNMIASCKALFDGLADALGVNDSRFVIETHMNRGSGVVKVMLK